MVSEILKQFLTLSKDEADKFDAIANALVEKNKVVNLTALTEPTDVAMLHFYDSLTLCDGEILSKDSEKSVIDVGCGAGFPSLPLSVFCPKSTFTLLDSTEKKLEFAKEQKQGLGLNIKTLAGRAEELSRERAYRESFDIATARGVARLNILCEWAMPFVRVGGLFVAMKGPRGIEEAEEAKSAIKTLGGVLERIIEAPIPLTERTHTIIVIRKTSSTLTSYPRENNKIQRRPL